MRVFRGLNQEFSQQRVLTIGNFDGLHLGHQAMLRRLHEQAAARGLPACVMSFEPHPREFFNPDNAPARLANLREKLEQFAELGMDEVIICPFNQKIANISADAFIDTLQTKLRTRYLLVGDDFCFGARRMGNVSLLKQKQIAGQFSVESFHSVKLGDTRVSSTAVRDALAQDDLAYAAALLGRTESMSGGVVRGLQLGRKWGFPTANVHLRHAKPPLQGVFVAQIYGVAATPLPAAVSLGWRPTIRHETHPLLEAHILDFAGDLYGKHIKIEFLHKLRNEAKFASTAALIAQIHADIAATRAYFHSSPSL